LTELLSNHGSKVNQLCKLAFCCIQEGMFGGGGAMTLSINKDLSCVDEEVPRLRCMIPEWNRTPALRPWNVAICFL
jgi:hypothetical protein